MIAFLNFYVTINNDEINPRALFIKIILEKIPDKELHF